jgi:hypothetical protein
VFVVALAKEFFARDIVLGASPNLNEAYFWQRLFLTLLHGSLAEVFLDRVVLDCVSGSEIV